MFGGVFFNGSICDDMLWSVDVLSVLIFNGVVVSDLIFQFEAMHLLDALLGESSPVTYGY